MSIFRDQLQLNWEIKEPMPRTNDYFGERLGAVVAEALVVTSGQNFTSHSDAAKWFKSWRNSGKGQQLSEFLRKSHDELAELRDYRDLYHQMSIADAEGYVRQWIFRVSTTVGVAVGFLAVWFAASWMIGADLMMPLKGLLR